jgi:hypothetical protein
MSSSMIHGVGRDARRIAGNIAARAAELRDAGASRQAELLTLDGAAARRSRAAG